MNNTKTTKRALLTSVVAIFLCVTMLIGTTFAWFTDTASTAVNKIQAGTLDVALEMSTDGTTWESAEGKTLTFKTQDNRAAGQILWEPGCTYELPQLRVVNKGNLALKYKIQITGINGNAKLNEVIDWTINDAAINLTEKYLLAGQMGDAFTIKGHMQETAGNEYQGLSIDGIGITVVATQVASEFDSFGNEYDQTAEYPISVAANVNVVNNKVTEEVTFESTQKVGTNNTPVAKVTVPSGAAVVNGTEQLELTVDEVSTPSNFVASIGTGTKTFEVDMKGLDKVANTELFKVELYVGTGLSSFKLYHNGTEMNAESSLNDLTQDQDYHYNSSTGVVTFLTKTFSPFTGTYDKDSWSNHAAASYATPVNTTDKIVTIASAGELALFANEVSSTTNYSSYTVNFANNIDLSEYIWKPINGWGRMNNIVFNGNHHTIENMIIQSNYEGTTGGFGIGFIGNTSGAVTFNDITFKNADASFDKDHTYGGNVGGIIMGYTYGTTIFNNVSVVDSAINGYGKIGAILGMGADPGVSVTFKNCVSKNNTIAAVYDMGGLAGLILRENRQDHTTVENCTVDNITVKLTTSDVYVNLDHVSATFKTNDKPDGEDIQKTISGNYWKYGEYYYGGYADYYVSYGNSSYDPPIEGNEAYIANSEYPVNKNADYTIQVNKDNIQDYLDGKYGSIDGMTLVLAEGDYNKLELGRATKYSGSNTDYYIGGVSEANKKTYDEFVTIKNNGQWSASAYYVRNMSNVTIKAAPGAAVTVAGVIGSAGHVYGECYDYVLDKAYTIGSAYYLTQNWNNIAFEGITFTAPSDIASSLGTTLIDGVTFKNCTFNIGNTAFGNQALRYYNENNDGNVRNLVVDNCKFNTCYQGVYTQKINGVTVINSSFNTTSHNAIAVQSDSEPVNHKAVVITGNTFENIGDRIIRFGSVGADTQITIKNNTATNSGDSSDQVMKAQSLAEGVTYDISGNNWGDGKTVANTELTDR